MILLALLACKSPTEKAWDHLAAGEFSEAVEDYERATQSGEPDPELLQALASWTVQNVDTNLNLVLLGSPGDFEPALEALLYVQHPLREPALLRLFDELDAQVAEAESRGRMANPAGGVDMNSALMSAATMGLRNATLNRALRHGPEDLRPTLRARYGLEPDHAPIGDDLSPEMEALAQRFEAGDEHALDQLSALLDGQPVPLASESDMDQLEAEMDMELPNMRTLNQVAAELSHSVLMSECLLVVERIPEPATRTAIYVDLAAGSEEQVGLLARHLARTGDPAGLAQLQQLREDRSWDDYAWIGLHRLGRAEGLEQAYLEEQSLVLAILVLEGR